MSIETDDLKQRIDRLEDHVDDLEKHVRDGEIFDEIKNRIEALERFDRKMDRFDNHDQRLDRLERITSTLSDEPEVDRMVQRFPEKTKPITRRPLPSEQLEEAVAEIKRLRADLDDLEEKLQRSDADHAETASTLAKYIEFTESIAAKLGVTWISLKECDDLLEILSEKDAEIKRLRKERDELRTLLDHVRETLEKVKP